MTNHPRATLAALTFIAACHGDDATYEDSAVWNCTDSTSASGVSPEDPNWDTGDATQIALSGDAVTVEGTGATADGSIILIKAAGTYILSGTLADGRVVVDTEDDGVVRLVLSGADISCSTNAAIAVEEADKVEVFLVDGTENQLADGASYVLEDGEDEPNAALFSRADLEIRGPGSLDVQGNWNDGIASKDSLVISNGSIHVVAMDDGIRGRDSVEVLGGTIQVESGGDGIKADNEEDASRGWILISDGVMVISAGDDGFASVTGLSVDGGSVWLVAADDGLHSDGDAAIGGGTLCIDAGDDAVHAGANLLVDGGDTMITESYEGLESVTMTIDGGTLHIISSDDGINIAGGADASGDPGGGPSGASCTDCLLTVNDGYVVIDAGGDGIDSNGSIGIHGGVILVHGPTEDMNGPMDIGESGATFEITGGLLVAAGSSGMAIAPDTTSTQYSVLVNLDQQLAGSLFHLESDDGSTALTFAPSKAWESVLVSSPDLGPGTWEVHLGGSCDGYSTDGLMDCGTYSGSQYDSFIISSVTTLVGQTQGGGPGGPP